MRCYIWKPCFLILLQLLLKNSILEVFALLRYIFWILIFSHLTAFWLWKKLIVLLAITFYHRAFKVITESLLYSLTFNLHIHSVCNLIPVADPLWLNQQEWISFVCNWTWSMRWKHQTRKCFFILCILYFYLYEKGKLLSLMWTRTLT